MNRISEIGSEQVEQLCQVEQSSHCLAVHHQSQLRPEIGLEEIFDLFPLQLYLGAQRFRPWLSRATRKAARNCLLQYSWYLSARPETDFNVAIRTIRLRSWRGRFTVSAAASLGHKNPGVMDTVIYSLMKSGLHCQ